jgi:hypothetical protein
MLKRLLLKVTVENVQGCKVFEQNFMFSDFGMLIDLNNKITYMFTPLCTTKTIFQYFSIMKIQLQYNSSIFIISRHPVDSYQFANRKITF